MRQLPRWRTAGIAAITVTGFLWHDLFTRTGSSLLTGYIAPVNESVWEHMKLGYWSVVILSVAEFIFLRNRVRNFFPARLCGILALELTILIIYYGYTSVAGKNILAFDIASYVLGAITGQYLTYWMFRLNPFAKLIQRASLIVLLSLGLLLGLTTYDPPHLPIFKDSRTNSYGIDPGK